MNLNTLIEEQKKELFKVVHVDEKGQTASVPVAYDLENLFNTAMTLAYELALEEVEWKQADKELPVFEKPVLCAIKNQTTEAIYYQVLITKNEDDALWFTADDESEINAWNWHVLAWQEIKPYQAQLKETKD